MKNVQKSIRMSDDVFEAVNAYRGEGFNEKLQNLVTDFIHSREDMEKYIVELQHKIAIEQKKIRSLQNAYAKYVDLDYRVKPVISAITDILKLQDENA